jgi:hypothetical protein
VYILVCTDPCTVAGTALGPGGAGDQQTLAGWENIVAESKVYFNDVYDRLGVLLTDEDAVGESFYNPFLLDAATDLEQRGIAVRSDGALCVFFDDILGPDGSTARRGGRSRSRSSARAARLPSGGEPRAWPRCASWRLPRGPAWLSRLEEDTPRQEAGADG